MNNKLVRFLKKNRIYLAIVLIGLLLRVYRIATEQVWGEEVIYLNIASLPFSDLVFVRHWLIDHPQGFLIFMHFWSKVSTIPIWIRIPNIIMYLVSSFWVYKISNLLWKEKLLQIILMSIYAILPYYVGIEWQAVPYVYAIPCFLASLYFTLKLLSGVLKKGERWKFVLSLLAWLFVSYEAIYYICILFSFLIFCKLFNLLNSKRIWLIVKLLSWVGLLFSPQAIVLLIRLREVVDLSRVLGWYNQGVFRFISKLFIPDLNWELGRYIVLLILLISVGTLIRRKLFGNLEAYLLWLVIGSWIIFVVGNRYFNIQHPRAFYVLVFSIVLFSLKIVGLLWSEKKFRRIIVMLGLFGGSLFVIGMKNDKKLWLARYAYNSIQINIVNMREMLIELIEKQEESGIKELVVLDDNFIYSDLGFFEGASLYDYYFKCLDVVSEKWKRCALVLDKRFEGEFNELVMSENINMNVEYVGIFKVKQIAAEYISTCNKNNLKCWIWSTEQDKFVKLNEHDQKDSDTIVTWFFYPWQHRLLVKKM